MISIVVPVWNRRDWVVQTLDSIAASTCKHFELIVVDNGSSDDSLSVCEQWAFMHRDDGFPIRVMSESKQGASAARNLGLMACRTEYVYFFDSDDILSAEFVGDVLSVLEKERPDMVYAPVCMEVKGSLKKRAYVYGGGVAEHLITSMMGTHSMVFRTQWLREIGGWNEQLRVWNDWELGVRALLAKPTIHWMKEKSYHRIVQHDKSLTGSGLSQLWAMRLDALREVRDEIQHTASLTERERRRCLRSLYLRVKICEGLLRRERCAEGAVAFQSMTADIFPHTVKPLQLLGMILCGYTAIGGRSAWRIALLSI